MLVFKLENVVDTRNLDRLADLYELMNEKRLTVSETGINYRMINHWDHMNIIRFGRKGREGNRKFSFVDFIWIKVVNELRAFGVKLPVIKKIAGEIYEPIPVKEIMRGFARHTEILDGFHGKDKEEFMQFIQSGEYETADFSGVDMELNYMQILMIEAIGTGNLVSLIVFDDGQWFPYIKSQEMHYPQELIAKKEMRSQVRISITDIVYRFITNESLAEYRQKFKLFNEMETSLIDQVKKGNFKKINILFKSNKRQAVEIKKSKRALTELVNLIREKDYLEFVLTDKKDNELRIKADSGKGLAILKDKKEKFDNLEVVQRGNKGMSKVKIKK
jgi:DNA-binding transcriptional MerR regulator